MRPAGRGARGPWAAALLVAATSAASPSPARAQQAPQVSVHADGDTVGVGDVLHVEMDVQSQDASPTDPQLAPTPGFVMRGQSSSPTQTHIEINGARIDRWGLTVDWTLQAQRVGTFTLGPPTIVVGGTRFQASGVTVHVVPAGQAPPPVRAQPPPSPFGMSPFDPWKQLFQGFPGFEPPQPIEPPTPAVTTDPKLALDAARGAYYFLHASVDRTSAVVGERVTFSVYEYIDASGQARVEVDDSDVHDATAADFVKHPLLRDDQDALLAGYASIGSRTWQVKLVRRWALFPLRAGDLTIGPMSVSLARPRSAAGKRATETLMVHVTEPPAAGRPAGYALGDVGHFALVAQVTPREVDQEGAVGVHVELSGTGNVPSTLATPARDGVEWLAPEVHEHLDAIGHEQFGGTRTFDYVVRIRRAGDVDLGEIALPFWDPDQRRYEVARAALGVVHAKPSPAAAARAQEAREEEKLAGLPALRAALEGDRPQRAHVDDRPVFWLLGIGAWPLAFGIAVVGRAASRRVARAWSARRASPAAELKERLAAASAACGGTDANAVDAAIARALEAAAVAHAGVSVRGAVGPEVADRLERAGVATQAASRVAELLRECEAARFSPGGADVVAARDRWQRAQGAIRELERS